MLCGCWVKGLGGKTAASKWPAGGRGSFPRSDKPWGCGSPTLSAPPINWGQPAPAAPRQGHTPPPAPAAPESPEGLLQHPWVPSSAIGPQAGDGPSLATCHLGFLPFCQYQAAKNNPEAAKRRRRVPEPSQLCFTALFHFGRWSWMG